jgi:ABC-2 type transport system ATP-binding protein
VDVTVRFGERIALDRVSVDVPPGSVVAVVGGDGAGKTTLLRTLIGRVVPDSGRVLTPDSRQIGYLPSGSGTWRALTVHENLDLVAHAYSDDPAGLDARRETLLSAAGLIAARDRLAGELSGGMRQKLGFCMAMLHSPRVVVLDEPSTGVDPVSRVELWGLVADAAADGTAVVLATTYLDEAARAHDVLVLDEGRVLLRGTPAEVLAASPGTVSNVGEPRDPSLAWRRGRRLHEWHDGAPRPADETVDVDLEDAVIAASLAARARENAQPSPTDERVSARPPRDGSSSSSGPLARTSHVSRVFGEELAVDDVSIEVVPGEIVGLIGANGAGKTTLIRMLLGVLEQSSGGVELFGGRPTRAARRRLGYVPQGLGLYGDLTVAENLAFVGSAYGAAAAPEGALVPLADELVSEIGLGRQRQLAFACALTHEPDLLVLDEPTSGVDAISRARLWDTIHHQRERGAGLLVSTHYMQEAEQCDRLVLMDSGRVVATGTVSEIVASTQVLELRTQDWAAAFAAMRSANLPVALAGTTVRVVDTSESEVMSVVTSHAIDATVRRVPATLDETLTALVRHRAAASTA